MITPQVSDASSDIFAFLIDSYRNERGVHTETIIGGGAALAGETILCAVEPSLPEKGWVISERATYAIFGLPGLDDGEGGLWNYIRQAAIEAGATMEQLPTAVEVRQRTTEAIGGESFPPISVPSSHYPHEWSPNACPRLRDGLQQIFAKHGVKGLAAARAVVLAITLLIIKTKDVLDPAISATLAIEVMTGVSRMAPMQEPIWEMH